MARGGGKLIRVDSRYTEAYGPHEVMLNIDRINIYTKMMTICDDDMACQIFVGRKELKVSSIGHCAMLEEDAISLSTEADVSAQVPGINGRKTSLKQLVDTGAVLSVVSLKQRHGWDSIRMT